MHHFHPARSLAGFNLTLFRLIPIMTTKNEDNDVNELY